MMAEILIFCEGITDQVFIADCLKHFYGIDCKKTSHKSRSNALGINFEFKSFRGRIIDVGGCTKLLTIKEYCAQMEDNIDLGGKNIIIFDADDSKIGNGNKGFLSCRQKLTEFQKKVFFSYYIWPNHEVDGAIEFLLRQLIATDKLPIIQCVESHQECLKQLEIPNLKYTTELKEIINYYLYTCNINAKLCDRSYINDYWNLNPQDNNDLLKFKTFLDPFFQ